MCRNNDYYKTVWYRNIGESGVRTFDSVKVGKRTAVRRCRDNRDNRETFRATANLLVEVILVFFFYACDWDGCSTQALIVVMGFNIIQPHITHHFFLGQVFGRRKICGPIHRQIFFSVSGFFPSCSIPIFAGHHGAGLQRYAALCRAETTMPNEDLGSVDVFLSCLMHMSCVSYCVLNIHRCVIYIMCVFVDFFIHGSNSFVIVLCI